MNGKAYIGITSQNPEARWGKNGCNYHDSPKFWNAIQKYGWSNFSHNILRNGLSQEDARRLEIQSIAEFDSIQNGYNITPGGDMPPVLFGSANPNYHKVISAETRKRMSLNHANVTGSNNPVARPVICIETGIRYDTLTSAANNMNVTRNAIAVCCRQNHRTCKGYHWKYADSDS